MARYVVLASVEEKHLINKTAKENGWTGQILDEDGDGFLDISNKSIHSSYYTYGKMACQDGGMERVSVDRAIEILKTPLHNNTREKIKKFAQKPDVSSLLDKLTEDEVKLIADLMSKAAEHANGFSDEEVYYDSPWRGYFHE